jgi:hypothetical protein
VLSICFNTLSRRRAVSSGLNWSGSVMDESTTTSLRNTGLPMVRELEELYLTLKDLKESHAGLTLWSQTYYSDGQTPADPDMQIIAGSLFRDGITQFVGCFDGDTNAFPLIVETVYPDVPEIAPTFKWLRGLRRSYTAHRFGSARQCVVGLIVNPEGDYNGHGMVLIKYNGPDKSAHPQLLHLIAGAIRHVETRIEPLRQEFAAKAREIPNPQDLPSYGLESQAPETFHKSRGEIRK